MRGLPDRQSGLGSFKRSRQLELQADRDAATMLTRAGYPTRIYQHALTFRRHSIDDSEIT